MTEIDKLENLKILYTNLLILQSFLRFCFEFQYVIVILIDLY